MTINMISDISFLAIDILIASALFTVMTRVCFSESVPIKALRFRKTLMWQRSCSRISTCFRAAHHVRQNHVRQTV